MITAQSYRKGIRKVSPIASCVAANTPVTLYQLTNGRTCVIRKIIAKNENPADTQIQIGTGLGAGYVQAMPGINLVADQDLQITEEFIPEVEFTADITVQATVAAAAPSEVDIMVEVEEYQGTAG
ncbi:MAG: hypothetical protein C4542_09565 [Dehalococcoidia bacterium]|nr:MAG: hypothetical protein C4542_09565 [Dehalococcoidia bacterium]